MQPHAPLRPVMWVGPSRHELKALPREVRDDFDRRTFRLMYTTMFNEAIYVLCAFPKKATRGIQTPRRLLALVEKRLRDARVIHALEAGQ